MTFARAARAGSAGCGLAARIVLRRGRETRETRIPGGKGDPAEVAGRIADGIIAEAARWPAPAQGALSP